MTAGKFRKKPVEIEAQQWLPADLAAVGRVMAWMDAQDAYVTETGKLAIRTLEGTMTADDGDWIIRGVQGEFYPCKPDIFAATYAPAETAAEGTALPNLGLATTRQLLDELRARIETDYAVGGGGLDYTTVHGRPDTPAPAARPNTLTAAEALALADAEYSEDD